MQNMGGILKDHPLAKLIPAGQLRRLGIRIGYDRASVMTNDFGRRTRSASRTTAFDAASFKAGRVPEGQRWRTKEVLSPVIGRRSCPRMTIGADAVDFFQQQTQKFDRAYDDITQNQMQFGGLSAHFGHLLCQPEASCAWK